MISSGVVGRGVVDTRARMHPTNREYDTRRLPLMAGAQRSFQPIRINPAADELLHVVNLSAENRSDLNDYSDEVMFAESGGRR